MRRKLSPEQKLNIEERRLEVMRLTKASFSVRQISDKLLLDGWLMKGGISPATIVSDRKVILARYRKEMLREYGELVTLMLMRLDAMLQAVWDRVLQGDSEAILLVLKIEERRAKLLGLDSWTNLIDMNDLENMSDEDLTRIANGRPPLRLAR